MLRFRWKRILVVSLGLAVLAAGTYLFLVLRPRDPADRLLERADDLAWNNDWVEAAPLYRKAELLCIRDRRLSDALYAHVSQFIPRADSEPIPALLLELERDESLPAARSPSTRLRILLIEGMIETNYDASMARKTWEQIESIAWRRGHYLLVARAMGEQGIAAFLLGDIGSAERHVQIAWITAKYLHDPAAHVRYASVYGAGLIELQQYDQALGVLNEAIATAARNPQVAYPSIAVNSKIDALRGLHRYDQALLLSDEAIRRLPASSLDAHLFQIFTSRGQIFSDMNRWEEAATVYSRALGYARHLQYWRGVAQTGGLLAQALEQKGRLKDALMAIDEAIEANKRLPQELYFVPRNLAIKAEILGKLSQVKASHFLYEKSLALIDSLIATAPTPQVERELITQLSVVYTGYFRSLANEGHLAEAFDVVEKARGRVEAQALEDHPLVLPHQASTEEQHIALLNMRLLESGDLPTKEKLERALRDEEWNCDESTLASRAANAPLSLAVIQHHLKPGELLLEYVLANPASWVLAITNRSAHSYTLVGKSEIEHYALRYEAVVRQRRSDPALGAALFQRLLLPVEEYPESSSIIIVPDGNLHLLPFSALVDRNEYVLNHHVLSVSPSATVLALLRDRESGTLQDSRSYVGVAAWSEDSESHTSIIRAATLGFPRPSLPSLPESKKEVEEIATNFPQSSTLLLGDNATETRFKELPLRDYRVLHLALHGYANIEFPDRSALIFAPDPHGTDDGLLEVREIRHLRLKSRLVTLSACNTGVGPIGASDIANMGNAFIEAGAETVVSTLWDLEDRTTERLMTDFYQRLSHHEDKVSSLREAQLDMAQAGLSPYYWAGFEVAGDPSGTL